MSRETTLFITTIVLMGASVALMAGVRNLVIRRRLLFGLLTLVAAAAVHVAAVQLPDVEVLRDHGWAIQGLLLTLAVINGTVTLAFNPWRRQGISDRAPAIVQDTVVAALGALVAMFLFRNTSVLAGSAIAAAIVGFALQDTLGNAFAGLAIQIEKPFRIGHWIRVGDHVGLVSEVTWRATKIRTKQGNLVVLPNSTVAKEAINNYSEPAAPTQLEVDVGVAYQTPPNEARDALLAAVRQAPGVLEVPSADVLLLDFGGSAIVYRTRFWVDDYSRDDQAMDAVRTAIYYELRRRNIEIPYPIQIEYSREEAPVDAAGQQERFQREIAAVPVLAPLPADAHRALAAAATERLYANGEVVVREGDPAGSMFVVCRGRVAITIGAERREVAVTERGGYFGEMSLLTGAPRTATVIARGDCTVLEISADAFREYVQARPEVIDQLAAGAAARQQELDRTRAAAGGAASVTTVSLAARMRRFFGLA